VQLQVQLDSHLKAILPVQLTEYNLSRLIAANLLFLGTMKSCSFFYYLTTRIYLLLLFFLFYFRGYSQCKTSAQIWNELLIAEKSDSGDKEKLKKVLQLQKQILDCKLPYDSVYARILHRLGVLQYYATGELNSAISNTLLSIEINRSNRKNVLPSFLANSYTNLGLYYKELLFYKEALRCFDSAVYFSEHFKSQEYFIIQSRLQRSNIFYRTGNFEKSIDESTLGMIAAEAAADDFSNALLLNERAQAMIFLKKYGYAKKDIEKARGILKKLTEVEDVIADSYRLSAMLGDLTGNYSEAKRFYDLAINTAVKYNNPVVLADNYLEAANFLDLKIRNTGKALDYYNLALKLSEENNDVTLKTKILNNIGALYKRRGELKQALEFYHAGLNTYIKGFTGKDVNSNPSAQQLAIIADKQLLFILLGNKAEALLLLYQQNGSRQLLQTANETFKLGDQVIDEMRYSQNTEPTKLYWRNKTRNFYSRAVTAAVESNDADDALFFMEKSRSVLLSDKLNELGAFAYLPAAEAAQEQRLRIGIFALQQQLNTMSDTAKAYAGLQQQFFTAREGFEKFIQSLEQKFPAYYQYKYGGIGFSVQKVQEYVKQQNATFISYFETDSTIYAVKVSGTEKKIFAIHFPQFSATANDFLQLCSNRQELNSSYSRYVQHAYSLYQQIFQPLMVQTKRVILSPDQVFLPFDALVKDKEGKQFLLYNYLFSYTYSASYLIQSANKKNTSGNNFLGVAPQNYAAGLQLSDLNGSAESITKIKNNYSSAAVLQHKEATRRSFLNTAGKYKMLHVYAHAVADSTKKEPQLFMQDSAISLSELQFIQNPAVQLIFLSACETNTGKQQRGEGVYSLARGFAAAGIPSTIATLWKADNEAMYKISEVFHQLIKKGLAKDEALQQARIQFIKDGSKENQLPFYWASSVLLGHTEPMQLSSSWSMYLFGMIALILAAVTYVYIKKKKGRLNSSPSNKQCFIGEV
jgi:CHAT domain-containing protein/tetratricopeptide (TPR) repeat protein